MKRTEKLLHLRDILENIKQSHFFMARWVHPHISVFNLLNDGPEECGFAGCAMGWACVDKTFNKMKLRFNLNGAPEYELENGTVKTNFSAAIAFFELSIAEADFLFYPLTYYRESILEYSVHSDVYNAMIKSGNYNNPFMVIQDSEEDNCFYQDDTSIQPEMVIRRIDFLLNPNTANAITQRN